MSNWIKVRRKVVKSKQYAGRGGSFGIAPRSPSVHVWLECGHDKEMCGTEGIPKTSICPKCSYRKGEAPPNNACTGRKAVQRFFFKKLLTYDR